MNPIILNDIRKNQYPDYGRELLCFSEDLSKIILVKRCITLTSTQVNMWQGRSITPVDTDYSGNKFEYNYKMEDYPYWFILRNISNYVKKPENEIKNTENTQEIIQNRSELIDL